MGSRVSRSHVGAVEQFGVRMVRVRALFRGLGSSWFSLHVPSRGRWGVLAGGTAGVRSYVWFGARARGWAGGVPIEGKMGRLDRRLLYAAATSDRLEGFVRRSRLLSRHCNRRAGRFVAGESLSDVVATVGHLVDQGFAVSVDRFGEGLDDPAGVSRVVEEYGALSRALADVDGDIYLEVVPSHLGIDVSVEFFCDRVLEVASLLPPGSRLEVSAEESHRTPRILVGYLGWRRRVCRWLPRCRPISAGVRATRIDSLTRTFRCGW